jgi:hypothetical protein
MNWAMYLTRPSRIVIVLFALLQSGCVAATGPLFMTAPIPQSQAVIYIYRKDLGYWQSAYTPTIFVDEQALADLPREGYCYTHVAAGTHKIAFKHNFLAGYPKVEIVVQVTAGQSYFIRVDDPVRPGLITTYSSIIRVVAEDIGISEIRSTRQVKAPLQ